MVNRVFITSKIRCGVGVSCCDHCLVPSAFAHELGLFTLPLWVGHWTSQCSISIVNTVVNSCLINDGVYGKQISMVHAEYQSINTDSMIQWFNGPTVTNGSVMVVEIC